MPQRSAESEQWWVGRRWVCSRCGTTWRMTEEDRLVSLGFTATMKAVMGTFHIPKGEFAAPPNREKVLMRCPDCGDQRYEKLLPEATQ